MMNKLNDEMNYPYNELKFMLEVSDAVIKCRHTLKWAFVAELLGKNERKEQDNHMFLFKLYQLEEFCDTAHKLQEMDMTKYLCKDINRSEFYRQRSEVVAIT